LFDTSAARSDSTDNHAIELDGNSAAKDYYPGVVGRVKPEALLARLRQTREVVGRHIKSPRSPSFIDCDIHAA
jgi:hypothetical protein